MADKPRVLFFIDSLKMGGAERITVAMMPHFTDITPIVCTLEDRPSPLLDQLHDVEHICIDARRLLDPQALKRFLQVVKDQRIDIIHAQLWYATIYAGIANKRHHVPVVTTRHVISDDLSTLNLKVIINLERLAIRTGTQRLIYVSEASRTYHQQAVHLPAPPTTVIYNGIDFDRFTVTQDRTTMRRSLGLRDDQPVAILVGVMRPGKGYEPTLDAAPNLPDVQFVLVGDGDGDYAAQLKSRAEQLSNVHAIGRRTDIADLLNMADVFILPSDSEALPTVLIEAGAMGLPVISTRVGGVPEVVQDGETGLLIPPRDPATLTTTLHELLANPARMKQMGASARDFVRGRFSIQQQTAELTALYHDVLAEWSS